MCETLEEIHRIANVSHSVISEDYLKRDIPVIVTDGLDNWPAMDKFNIHFLNEVTHISLSKSGQRISPSHLLTKPDQRTSLILTKNDQRTSLILTKNDQKTSLILTKHNERISLVLTKSDPSFIAAKSGCPSPFRHCSHPMFDQIWVAPPQTLLPPCLTKSGCPPSDIAPPCLTKSGCPPSDIASPPQCLTKSGCSIYLM